MAEKRGQVLGSDYNSPLEQEHGYGLAIKLLLGPRVSAKVHLSDPSLPKVGSGLVLSPIQHLTEFQIPCHLLTCPLCEHL